MFLVGEHEESWPLRNGSTCPAAIAQLGYAPIPDWIPLMPFLPESLDQVTNLDIQAEHLTL